MLLDFIIWVSWFGEDKEKGVVGVGIKETRLIFFMYSGVIINFVAPLKSEYIKIY